MQKSTPRDRSPAEVRRFGGRRSESPPRISIPETAVCHRIVPGRPDQPALPNVVGRLAEEQCWFTRVHRDGKVRDCQKLPDAKPFGSGCRREGNCQSSIGPDRFCGSQLRDLPGRDGSHRSNGPGTWNSGLGIPRKSEAELLLPFDSNAYHREDAWHSNGHWWANGLGFSARARAGGPRRSSPISLRKTSRRGCSTNPAFPACPSHPDDLAVRMAA